VTQRALRIPRAVFTAAGGKGAAALEVAEVIAATLPAFTFANDTDGEEYLKAGAYCANAGNVENPELYASHPFPLLAANRSNPFGFEDTDTRYFEMYLTNEDRSAKDPRAIGLATYKNRAFPNGNCGRSSDCAQSSCAVSCGEWQEPMQAARLGMAAEAKRLVQARYAMQDQTNHQMRFPGFYGNIPCDVNYLPDDEHAANARTALQWMLLQDAPMNCPGENATHRSAGTCDQILVLPAWPEELATVSFKLHAWHNTTVLLSCGGGKLKELVVEPEVRRKDLVFVAVICRPASE
jgi:hypothetical protein